MSRRFLTPINVVRLSSEPVSATQGDLYYNTGDNRLYTYNGSAWVVAGLQGVQGTTGSQGLQGTTGLQGLNGSQGVQGTQGISVQGLQGIQGPSGGGGGGGNYTVSDTPPVSPSNGDTWFNSSTTRTYVYYADGTSSQWVEASSPVAAVGLLDGGSAGSTYGGIASINAGSA